MISNFSKWCIEQHVKTNHYYDDYLPYEFHLRMVNQVFEDFKHLIDKDENYYNPDWSKPWEEPEKLISVIGYGIWAHDLIEDARVSYNNLRSVSTEAVANVAFACTNYRGKTREERAPDGYYDLIRATKGADFVKICDRIANIQYSKLTKSRMYKTYQEEHEGFVRRIGTNYPSTIEYMTNLFH